MKALINPVSIKSPSLIGPSLLSQHFQYGLPIYQALPLIYTDARGYGWDQSCAEFVYFTRKIAF